MSSTHTTGEVKDNNLLIAGIGIIFLALGLGIGYMMFSAPASTASGTNMSQQVVASTESFSIDNSKVTAQLNAMEKLYTMFEQPIDLTVNSMKVGPDGLIEVNVSNAGDNNTAIFYFTKSYKFVSSAPFDLINYTADAEKELAAEKAAAAASNSTATTAPTATVPKTDKPKMELYVMSYCPYGNQAEQGLYQVIKAMNNTFDFEPVYIISGSTGKWGSLHGASELNQDIREKIIYNLYGTQVWNEYVNNANTKCTLNTIDTCWKDAAQGVSAINISAVEALYNTTFDDVAKANADKSAANKVSGSPTVLINGGKYSGGRTADAFKTGICNAFNTQPSECNQTFSTTAAAASGSCG